MAGLQSDLIACNHFHGLYIAVAPAPCRDGLGCQLGMGKILEKVGAIQIIVHPGSQSDLVAGDDFHGPFTAAARVPSDDCRQIRAMKIISFDGFQIDNGALYQSSW